MAAVFREEAGRLTAALVKQLGDFDLAEECVQDALVSALEHWPREGIPNNPGAWLMTTARRKGIDRLRREKRYQEKVAELEEPTMNTPTPSLPDERLELIFTCCHPALAREAQVALTLRSVAGLTTPEIARAFLFPRRPSPNGSSARSGRSSTRTSRSACPIVTRFPSGSRKSSPCST